MHTVFHTLTISYINRLSFDALDVVRMLVEELGTIQSQLADYLIGEAEINELSQQLDMLMVRLRRKEPDLAGDYFNVRN